VITLKEPSELRHWAGRWRRDDMTVCLVPTMGNLHRGHLALVQRARDLADRVAVSIFVNPLQFGQGEDFDRYPRTLERDLSLLEAEGVHLVFTPGVDALYPRPAAEQTRVEVPGLSDILCGASRPGHFVGVATVVCKLLNLVRPDVAVFGEKDFQQLMVLRRMVEDLNMPVRVAGLPTVREPDGLAMSSRNAYLSEVERRQAPTLFLALQRTAEAVKAGDDDLAALERKAVEQIAAGGLGPDYVSIRRANDLGLPGPVDRDLVVLAAACLGPTRLIDNLRVSRG
jgi:pantoate--beta-alanine ligase